VKPPASLYGKIGALICTLWLALTSFSAPLHAQEAAPAGASVQAQSKATQLKTDGDEAMGDLRYAEALELYTESYALVPNPALLYNRGRALEALARFPEALAQIERFAREAPLDLKKRVPQLDELIETLRRNVCTLKLDISVEGARVLLRSEQIAESPVVRPLPVNAGRATLEVVAEGYRPFKKQVVLPGAGELSLEIALEPLSDRGVLIVEASVAGAVVYVDGERAGTSPVQRDLKAGRHEVRVVREGFEAAETTGVVHAGKTTRLDITLDQKPGLAQKWWFWTGVSVLVLGGAAAGYALLTERSAGRGSIPPGRVAAPLVSF